MAFANKFKDWMNVEDEVEGEEYIEVQAGRDRPSFLVKSFVLKEFEDVKPVLKVLRSGRYVVLVDLKPLKENDVVDLRRAVNKLKAIAAEIAGDIAGLSGDWVVITPHPIQIEKNKPAVPAEREEEEEIF